MRRIRPLFFVLAATIAGFLAMPAEANPPLAHVLDTPNPQGGALFGFQADMGDATGDGYVDMLVSAVHEDTVAGPGRGARLPVRRFERWFAVHS